MARFDFSKRSADDEGIPPEPVEGETAGGLVSEPGDSGGRPRRPLILAVIGIACVVLGGLYLANVLFFSAPPAPTTPPRQTVPAPGATPPAPVVPTPTKEAAPAPSPTIPPASPGKPEAKTEPKAKPSEAAKAPAPVKAAPSAKASPELSAKPAPQAKASREPAASAAKGEAKASSKASVATTKGFSLQVGAMAQEANAEKLKQKLSAMGYQAVIRKGSGFSNHHIVTVGDPSGRHEAEEMARRLNVDGFPSKLIVVEGKYTPEIGSFVILDEALDLARELQKKNYRPKITSKPATTILFQVRHGQFDTRAAAIKRGEELKAKGVTAWVVPN
jgi:cell division septation protein DedD